MTSRQRPDPWAWDQIEAAADASLSAEELRRFERAAARDPQLAAAAERARTIREQLRRMPHARVPRGLLGRLWGIPASGHTPTRAQRARWTRRLIGPAVAAGLATIVVTLLLRPDPVERDQRAAAIEDFALAMAYLQRSATIAGNEVHGRVRRGVIDAYTLSREALLEADANDENGG
jgi:hypothetical protein